jgi:putative chitinase
MTPTREMLVAVKIKDPDKWLEVIKNTCHEFEINTPERIASFLAQTAHESAGYTMLEENLNYSDVTMAAVWEKRFAVQEPDPNKAGKTRPKKDEKGKNIPNAFAKALHRKPELIANAVYSNRMGNGTIESGEGWKHRGMGLKQLTGKDNHKRCGEALGVDFVANPALLLEPNNAARSAGWFWKTNNLSQFADAEDIKGMTQKINGGLIGLADRQARYDACIAVCRA